MKDLHSAIQSCVKTDHHTSMEQRLNTLEKVIGESADKHDNHKTTMETRLEYIEGLIGDSADKHVKEIAAAKEKMKDLHSAIQSCVKTDHHTSMEQRVNYLEKVIGESADKHDNHKTTME